jgi:hypothetical protein
MEKIISITDDVVLEKVSIMIDILMQILNCSYSDAYNIIIKSRTYSFLIQKDYSTMHDSPQANLSSIGEELRIANNHLGKNITDENIKVAMLKLRQHNLSQITK